MLSVGYDYSDLGLVLLGRQGKVLATSPHLECHPHSEVIYIDKIENGIIYASCGYGDGPCGVTYSHELNVQTLEVMDSSTEQYCADEEPI